MITLKVGADIVVRTLVDTKSLMDIIFNDTLDQLIFESIKVTPNHTLLVGFTSEIVIPKEIMTLPILGVKSPHKLVYMVNYLGVDYLLAYNIILGWLFIATIGESVTIHYLAIKTLTLRSIFTIKGN